MAFDPNNIMGNISSWNANVPAGGMPINYNPMANQPTQYDMNSLLSQYGSSPYTGQLNQDRYGPNTAWGKAYAGQMNTGAQTDPNWAEKMNSPGGYFNPGYQPPSATGQDSATGFSMVGGGTGSPSAVPAAQANYSDPNANGTGPANGGGNPYLQGQASALTNTAYQNFTRNTLPAIRGSAMQAGGLGGSRQGVIEANATNDMNTSLNNSLANLYGTDWTNQQNRNLTDQGQQNSFYLGNRSLDQSGAQLGANMFISGMNGQWSPINNANATYSPYTGLGSTSSGTSQGGGLMGAIGGGLAGASLAQQNKWW